MERGNKERKQRRTNKFHSFAQNHVLHQNRNYLRESPKIKTTMRQVEKASDKKKTPQDDEKQEEEEDTNAMEKQ